MEGIEMTDEALTELNRKIAVMQAYRDGKEIECTGTKHPESLDGKWRNAGTPSWNWRDMDYRVKAVEPQKLVGLRCRGETVHSAWHNAHRAGAAFSGAIEASEKVEFIELTPEVREKLNL